MEGFRNLRGNHSFTRVLRLVTHVNGCELTFYASSHKPLVNLIAIFACKLSGSASLYIPTGTSRPHLAVSKRQIFEAHSSPDP